MGEEDLPRWLRPKDNAPEWSKGDQPWWVFFLFLGSILAVVALPGIWLGDRGFLGRGMVVILLAVLFRWFAWVLPRTRKRTPPRESS